MEREFSEEERLNYVSGDFVRRGMQKHANLIDSRQIP